jgi:3-phosphoshikimate 1-carboxyvinyltransferase
MLAAMAEGTSELRHFAAAADCHSTLDCMSALGATVKIENDTVKITGRGAEGLKGSWRALDAGNSGTTIRLLTGILAGQNFTSKLTGDSSLQKRPMGRVVSPLRQMGADIRAREDNFAPLEIRAAKLRAIHYKMPMPSAQVKSAVLLAGLFAEGLTSVIEPVRTRDHTELALENSASISRTRQHHSGSRRRRKRRQAASGSLDVPGDISSAVFPRCRVDVRRLNLLIHNVGLNPRAPPFSTCLQRWAQRSGGVAAARMAKLWAICR